jgi:hypothetical protein
MAEEHPISNCQFDMPADEFSIVGPLGRHRQDGILQTEFRKATSVAVERLLSTRDRIKSIQNRRSTSGSPNPEAGEYRVCFVLLCKRAIGSSYAVLALPPG